MESKGTTVVASCIHQALTDSHRYTTLTDATLEVLDYGYAASVFKDAHRSCVEKYDAYFLSSNLLCCR